MLEAIGMNRLIRHNATPTITNAITKFIKGIFFSLPRSSNSLPNRALPVAGRDAENEAPESFDQARHVTKCGQQS